MKAQIHWALSLLSFQTSLTLATRSSNCDNLTWPQKPFCTKYPLHWASTTNNVTAVERLLENGAYIDQKTGRGYTGNTALHIASRYGRAEVARVLIRNGANRKVRNNNGEYPKDRAALKFCQWNPSNSWCKLADSDYAATLVLLEYGCATTNCATGLNCVSDHCKKNTHAIPQTEFSAARHNTIRQARILRDACGPHTWFWWSEDRCQKYPFHWAAVAGDEAKVANYLRDGTEVDLRDGDRYTPLMLAAWAGRAGTVSMLLANGADHSLTNVRGRTALLLASKNFCRDPNSKGCKLGMVNYDQTVQLLRKGCATFECIAGLKCVGGQCMKQYSPDTSVARNIHKKCGPHIWPDWSDQRCEDYPFHWAALTGNNDEVQRLIYMHTDVNLRDGNEYRYTPLMHAAWAGHADTVKLLLNHGADASLTNVRRQTALDLAKKQFCRSSWRGCKPRETDYDETIAILQKEQMISATSPATLTLSGRPCVRFLYYGHWYEANTCKCCWNSKTWCATSTTYQGYIKDWDYCATTDE